MYWYVIQLVEREGPMSRNTSVTLGEHFVEFVNNSISAGRSVTNASTAIERKFEVKAVYLRHQLKVLDRERFGSVNPFEPAC